MAYLVEISPSALNDIETAFLRLRRESPDYADQWFNELLEAIASLEKFPNRCPLAPESAGTGNRATAITLWKVSDFILGLA